MQSAQEVSKKLPIDQGSPFDDPSPSRDPYKDRRDLEAAKRKVDRTRKSLPKTLKGKQK